MHTERAVGYLSFFVLHVLVVRSFGHLARCLVSHADGFLPNASVSFPPPPPRNSFFFDAVGNGVLHVKKVDTMIVQAIGLLDELDKEINTYAMRVKEWFGWHFPEMAKVLFFFVVINLFCGFALD